MIGEGEITLKPPYIGNLPGQDQDTADGSRVAEYDAVRVSEYCIDV